MSFYCRFCNVFAEVKVFGSLTMKLHCNEDGRGRVYYCSRASEANRSVPWRGNDLVRYESDAASRNMKVGFDRMTRA